MAVVPQESALGPTLYLIFTADFYSFTTNDKVLTSTFADDTAILSSYNNPVIASVELNDHLKCMELCFNHWRIRINELKSNRVTFTLRKGDRQPVFFIIHSVSGTK